MHGSYNRGNRFTAIALDFVVAACDSRDSRKIAWQASCHFVSRNLNGLPRDRVGGALTLPWQIARRKNKTETREATEGRA